MNELVMPFKAIQMDDTEFACLKVSKNTCLHGVAQLHNKICRRLCSLIRTQEVWEMLTGSRVSAIRSK